MRSVNSFFGFGFCQRLHVRVAVDVRGEHDLRCAVNAEVEDRFEDMHNKVHRRYIVVVDDDFVERLEFGFGFFENFGEDLIQHFLPRRARRSTKEKIHFPLSTFIAR